MAQAAERILERLCLCTRQHAECTPGAHLKQSNITKLAKRSEAISETHRRSQMRDPVFRRSRLLNSNPRTRDVRHKRRLRRLERDPPAKLAELIQHRIKHGRVRGHIDVHGGEFDVARSEACLKFLDGVNRARSNRQLRRIDGCDIQTRRHERTKLCFG